MPFVPLLDIMSNVKLWDYQRHLNEERVEDIVKYQRDASL